MRGRRKNILSTGRSSKHFSLKPIYKCKRCRRYSNSAEAHGPFRAHPSCGLTGPNVTLTNDGPSIWKMTQCDDPESIPSKTRVIVFPHYPLLSIFYRTFLWGLYWECVMLRFVRRRCCALMYTYLMQTRKGLMTLVPFFWDWLHNLFIFGFRLSTCVKDIAGATRPRVVE